MTLRVVNCAMQEEKAFDDLKKTAAKNDRADPEKKDNKKDKAGEKTTAAKKTTKEEKTDPRYMELKKSNPDFFGWLSIEGTVLDYPVMYTPNDPEYYLHRNFDGEYSYSGVPFIQGDCREGCGNYLMHGHNMKNGSMFAGILFYKDKSYWKEHPVISFDTPYENGEYEVMSAFYSKVYMSDEENVFKYYKYTDLSDKKVFDEYAKQVKAAALYDTGVDAEYGDEFITLSTCAYHTENGRFVVVARKKH